MLNRLRSLALILTGLVCLLGSDYAAAMYDPGTGRFLQRDPSGYPDGMNAYGAYHVMRGEVDPSGEKSWNVSTSECVIELELSVQVKFHTKLRGYGGGEYSGSVWSYAQKVSYQTDLKNVIETQWSTSHTGYKIHPTAGATYTKYFSSGPAPHPGARPLVFTRECPCPCPDGFEIKTTLNFVAIDSISWNEDLTVHAIQNPTPPAGGSPWRPQSQGSSFWLASVDLTPQFLLGAAPGVQQVLASHEFGHFMGIDHPGHNKPGITPGTTPEYTYSGDDHVGHKVDGPNDLMGAGDDLREFYFYKWQAELDKRYRGCGWHTK